MMKRHVKVVVRLRLTSAFAQDLIKFGEDKQSVSVNIPRNVEYINNQPSKCDFKFDSVLNNTSQETLFEDCALPVVKSLLDGFNGTVLAYGQTATGKTFTMTGATENYKQRGIIPRSISQIFKDISDRPTLEFTVKVSYLEVYNEQLVDLLVSDSKTHPLTVYEDKNGVHVKGLKVLLANNEEEALNMLFEGDTKRTCSAHQMNKFSSRSHCIFTIHVQSKSRIESADRVLVSKLNLVDLAGSERLSKTETSGATLKEAMYINRSLTYLEQVIIALADKKREHVPFRQSKLTHVLRDSIGGNCNTLMIANISGEQQNIDETIATLRFSTRMMCVAIDPQINVHYDPMALVRKYEAEIKELKQELNMYDLLSNRGGRVIYETYNEVQKNELWKIIKAYIDSDSEELEVINIRQIKESFIIFRNMYKQLEQHNVSLAASRLKPADLLSESRRDSSARPTVDLSLLIEAENGLGDLEGGGFGVGKAHSNGNRKKSIFVKSSTKTSPSKLKLASEAELPLISSVLIGEILVDKALIIDQTLSPAKGGQRPTNAPLSRAEEFEVYKKSKGSDLKKKLQETKCNFASNLVNLQIKRKQAKEIAERINSIKRDIDSLKDTLNMAVIGVNEYGDNGVIISEAQLETIRKLKSLKDEYKLNYAELNEAREDIERSVLSVDQCRQKNMAEFEDWFDKRHAIVSSEGNTSENMADRDTLDIGEKFDRLALDRMSQEDPSSFPFYNAKKTAERKTLKLRSIIK